MKAALRAWRIGRVALRYRLDDLFDAGRVPGWVRTARSRCSSISAS